MTDTNNNLDNFFDDLSNDEDFFSVDEVTTKVVETETNTEDEKQKKVEKPEEENFFEEEEEDKTKENIQEEEEEETFTAISYLEENGYIDLKVEEGEEELDEETVKERIKDSYEEYHKNKIDTFLDGMPEELKNLNKYVMNGGNAKDFMTKTLATSSSKIHSKIVLKDNVDNQKLIIAESLKNEGYEEDYIEEQIKFLEDSNRLEKHATKHFDSWKEKRKQEEDILLKEQERKIEFDRTQQKELRNKIDTYLTESSDANGLTITNKDKDSLPDYMIERTIKLENGSNVTPMQADLMTVLNNPKGAVQIAKLLRKHNKGEINFDEIIKKSDTKITKKVKANIRRKSTNTNLNNKSGGRIRLADNFE